MNKGYNKYQLLSALQKDIRRGNEIEALHWAVHLEKGGYKTELWNRLVIIASEDIGIANPIMPVIIETVRKHYEEAVKRRHSSYRVFLSNAIINLCRSPKSRVADDLLWVVYTDIEYNEVRKPIPSYAKDHHVGTSKNGIDIWCDEGCVLNNEADDIQNPYKEKAKENVRKHKKLPSIFPISSKRKKAPTGSEQ